jgi:hypothetical protein
MSTGAPTPLRVHFLGASASAPVQASEPLPTIINDYRGNDPQNWHLKIPTYARVSYSEIYPGIDIAYHRAKRGFEYDLLVAPGADPSRVRLEFEGAEHLNLDSSGSLVAILHGGTFVQPTPVVYQEVAGKRRRIDVAYRLESETVVRFELGAYDVSKPLIIDPLAYSKLFFYSDNAMAHHIAIDSAGNAYVAAEANTVPQQPANQTTHTKDAIIQKIAPDGTLLWRSWFHGTAKQDHDDVANGIALDAAGNNVFVVGTTTSDDFPTTNSAFATTCGAGAGCNGMSDAFVMKLNAANGSQLYSSYFGSPNDDTGNAIAVDAAGFVYITGAASITQFPVQGPSHASHSGSSRCTLDAYLAKFDLTKSGAASLVFSTLIGGDGDDHGTALAIAPGQIRLFGPCTRFPCPILHTGSIYVAGTTGDTCKAKIDSTGQPTNNNFSFPTTPNAFLTDGGFAPLAFVALLDTNGTNVLYSTVSFGMSALGVAVAPHHSSNPFLQGFSNAIITGATPDSGPSPTPAFQSRYGGGLGSDAYAAEFDPTTQGAGSSLVYFTYLGGSGDDIGYDIATDALGNATIVGSTTSTNFPLPHTLAPLSPVQAARAACTAGNCRDAFVAIISSNGRAEGYATYLGGGQDDWATGVALCSSPACAGSIYLTGTTHSTDFPGTGNTFVGGPDAFVTKISPPPSVIKPPTGPVH